MSRESREQHRHRMDRKHERNRALKKEQAALIVRLHAASDTMGFPRMRIEERASKRSLESLADMVEQGEAEVAAKKRADGKVVEKVSDALALVARAQQTEAA